MDLQAANQFISAHGDPAEQARLRWLTLHEPPDPFVREACLAGQRRDGGWAPFWDPEYSSLDATCFRLSQARQLGIGAHEPEIVRALAFLVERQSSRGSWEEDASEAAVAPPWASPGEPRARLYLTSNCGYWLALPGGDRPAAKRAASFLRRRLKPDGSLPTYLNSHWLAAGLWLRLERSEPAEAVMGWLLTRLSELSPASCAWLITALRTAGAPASTELLRAALAALEAGQQPDGRWVSDDGPGRDVNATLEALHAIQLCRTAEDPL